VGVNRVGGEDRGTRVIFDPLFDDVRVPSQATDASAGYDVHAYLKGRTVTGHRADGSILEVALPATDDATLALPAGATVLVPLGFRARLPVGVEAQLRMRSSWALRYGLTLPNAPGTIDPDYPDEWMVMMAASNARGATIRHGDRIAQAVLARYERLEWEPGVVRRSTDRDGGFGSTG